MNNEQYEFNEREHLAGFHTTYQKECSECYKENRMIKAKCVCNDWNNLYPDESRNDHALSMSDFSTNNNPLE